MRRKRNYETSGKRHGSQDSLWGADPTGGREREPVLVERGGKPYVVLLSVEEYEHLKAIRNKETWRETVAEILRLGSRIKSRRKGKLLTPPEEIIHELREERDAKLSGLR